MTAASIIILLVTGLGVGFIGGLLGVGGGFIMVPIQYMVFIGMGVPADVAIKLAFGTNLAVVLPAAVSGMWLHNKKGAVFWKATIVMGSFGMVAAYGGAALAAHIAGEALKIAFGVIILVAVVGMLTARLALVEREPN